MAHCSSNLRTKLSGAKRGTEGYRAPELLGETPQYSFKTDVWSLGCVLYELSFGAVAFSTDWKIRELDGSLQAPVEKLLTWDSASRRNLFKALDRTLDSNPVFRVRSDHFCEMMASFNNTLRNNIVTPQGLFRITEQVDEDMHSEPQNDEQEPEVEQATANQPTSPGTTAGQIHHRLTTEPLAQTIPDQPVHPRTGLTPDGQNQIPAIPLDLQKDPVTPAILQVKCNVCGKFNSRKQTRHPGRGIQDTMKNACVHCATGKGLYNKNGNSRGKQKGSLALDEEVPSAISLPLI